MFFLDLMLECETSLIDDLNEHLWLVLQASSRAVCRLASDLWLCAVLGNGFCGLETADRNSVRWGSALCSQSESTFLAIFSLRHPIFIGPRK
jgi:hypothetical protein